jgi:predicted alpha/beta-fold hydrolase
MQITAARVIFLNNVKRSFVDMVVLQPNHFMPPWLLRNGHVQSVLPSLKLRRPLLARRARAMLGCAREHILDCGAGVRLMGLHSAHAATADAQSRPLVILLHGWEGHAESSYIISLGSYLFDHGFDVFRLNFRDHGPTHHLNRDLFHSCRIDEVVGAVQAVQKLFAPPSLSIAGFSLGGNFALRVAARAPKAGIGLAHTIAVCPVLHPKKALDALETGWFLYERYFIHKWKRSLKIKQRCFPEHFDFGDILRMKSLNGMTDVMVRQHTEFRDMPEYLNGYSIVDAALANLQVDSHVILAEDDPIIPVQDAKLLAQSPHLKITTVKHGGHCGFLDRLHAESWIDRTVLSILSRSQQR